jgi:transcriptional regulator with XRE-family HTH domain
MRDSCDICLAFGRAVRARRVELELSQEKFAMKAGLDRTYVSGVERGVRNVSLRNIAVIANALEEPIPRLMERMLLECTAE